jgi:cytochrome c oxidase assembly factor CtaG
VTESAVALIVSAVMFVRGIVRMRARRGGSGWGLQRWEVLCFAVGWTTLVLALMTPLATAADVLFSMHMTQHELLMLVAAPLLMLGRPVVPILFALPDRWRMALAGSTAASGFVVAPLSVFVLHGVVLWAWHIPSFYEAAVLDDRIHLIQHVSFVATACLFWWGLLRGRYGRLGYGAAVFYVFATALHSGGLGALITSSTEPWYPLYVQRAHPGADPLVDQQIAGLIMWIPAGVVLTIFGLAIFAAWLGEGERRRRLAGG